MTVRPRQFVGAALVVVGLATECPGDDGDVGSSSVANGLATNDWLIIVLYAAGTIGLGWYYGRRQKSTNEYFVGSGKMNPFLIGVSLFATLLSTISYLSKPGETLGKGPVDMFSLVALPLSFLFVGFVLLPVYMRQRVTSAYELLETRLDSNVRLLGAGMFIILRLVWMSLLIYLTAKALTIMLGVSDDMIPVIALVTGFVAVTYTSLGGLRAVVITDLLQTILLFGGAVLVIAMVTVDLGGFGWVPTSWNPSWDTQPVFSTDPSTRVTFFGTVLSYFLWFVCTSGGDQTSVQRFMATENAAAARRALLTQIVVSCVVVVTLGFVGFALLGYFSAHPDQLPPDVSLKDDADEIFPYFIAYRLPPGVSGLVVAAMFAAAMSSVDSGVNSITAVVMSDILDRFGKAPANDYEHVRTARRLAFVIGAIVVIASSGMGAIPGNITAVTQKTSNLLTTPLFALFFFALFVPFASPKGVLIGAVFGITAAVLTAFSGPIFGFVDGAERDPISFQWIGAIALTVNIIAGLIASLLFPRSNDSPGPLTNSPSDEHL